MTPERLKELVSYDPESGVFTRLKITRGAHVVCGNLRLDGYVSLYLDGKARSAHRMAWLYVYGSLPETALDHMNGVRHDNRICNLRPATRSQNLQNLGGPYKNNKNSGLLGVYKFFDEGKWQARIQIDGKSKSLGLYKTKEDAFAAYKAAKAEVHPFCVRPI